MAMAYALGVISGTSMDAIDLAIIEVDRNGDLSLVAAGEEDYNVQTRQDLLAFVKREPVTLEEVSHFNFVVGHEFSEAVLGFVDEVDISLEGIDVIGTYGQTVRHFPDGDPPSTLQLIEAPIVAERTGVDTVAGFFVRDLVTGGSGAPSLALFNLMRYGDSTEYRLVLNIGRIANVSYLPAKAGLSDVRAFDVGPGNMLIDANVRELSDGAERFDVDGTRARRGTVDEALLAALLEQDFIAREPPKSTGRNDFGPAEFERVTRLAAEHDVSGDDLLVTLAALTAEAIALNVEQFVDGPVDRVLVFGGGSQNPAIVDALDSRLDATVDVSEERGFRHDVREVQGIAYLAYRAKRGNQTNVPAATGGKPVSAGSLARGSCEPGL